MHVLRTVCAAVTIAVTATPLAQAADDDFGAKVETLLEQSTHELFGFGKPLDEPADDVPRAAGQPASQRQDLAQGLHAHYVSRRVARHGDMIAFWPNDKYYKYLIVCIEQSRETGSGNPAVDGENPSVQRINVQYGPHYGEVETILYGMDRCDGIRTTAWGTVLATEETDDGRGYEIIDPVHTTGHWVADRSTGDIRDGIGSATPSSDIVQRDALPTMAWEGLYVHEIGVVYGGDELRPGDEGLEEDGGALFKFVPDNPFVCDRPVKGSFPGEGGVCNSTIDDLTQSPLAAGRVYAFTASAREADRSDFPQMGQGAEIGQGAWVRVRARSARSNADDFGATGYYRPEDLHGDPNFRADEFDVAEVDPEFDIFEEDDSLPATATRLCWNNTGNPNGSNFAEVMCAIDLAPLGDGPDVPGGELVNGNAVMYQGYPDAPGGQGLEFAIANRFVEGDPRFNSFDNLDFQPKTGNVYVVEDHDNGEIFACLPDEDDRDIKTDGCVSMLSVADPEAEPSGFIFDGTGRVAYYHVQHGSHDPALDDTTSNPVCEDDDPDDCTGFTDDLIKISGFDLFERHHRKHSRHYHHRRHHHRHHRYY